jgi:hypothetical protein
VTQQDRRVDQQLKREFKIPNTWRHNVYHKPRGGKNVLPPGGTMESKTSVVWINQERSFNQVAYPLVLGGLTVKKVS